MLLAHLLGHAHHIGTVRVIDWDGEIYVFFPGSRDLEVNSAARQAPGRQALLIRSSCRRGLYDGTLTVRNGGKRSYDFIDLASWNWARADPPAAPF